MKIDSMNTDEEESSPIDTNEEESSTMDTDEEDIPLWIQMKKNHAIMDTDEEESFHRQR